LAVIESMLLFAIDVIKGANGTVGFGIDWKILE
jgi:hypothetical protein